MTFAIVTHGGVGHTAAHADGCQAAANAAAERLRAGAEALEAAVAAAVVLEDDGRFNAGTGGNVGLDGETKQLDAGLMDSLGRLAAVAGIERVKNPILVARALADTPLRLLAGSGATAFARAAGFEDFYCVTESAREKLRETITALTKGEGGDFPPEWHRFDFARYCNTPRRWDEIVARYGHGTIGAVVRDAEGRFAACVSTGGSDPMPLGRVGDTPLVGCGYFAGPVGAIVATGIGEYNIRHMVCRTAYEHVEAGVPLQDALARVVALLPAHIDIGLIGVTRTELAHSANKEMPVAHLEG